MRNRELMNGYFRRNKAQSTFDGIFEHLISEGLNATYGTEKLKTYFVKRFGNRIRFDGVPPEIEKQYTNPKFGISYTIIVDISNPTEDDIVWLNKAIELFGYYISQQDKDSTGISLQLEPKYSVDITEYLKEHNIQTLYHITPKSNLSKIQKFGLAPRASETTFYHPDDRIYLLSAPINIVRTFIQTLSRRKNIPESEYIILATNFDDSLKYYVDDTTTGENFLACFVLKNIAPNKIRIIID